jgi:hypothetical protein
MALWRKLPVGERMNGIFHDMRATCPLDGTIEGHHHRLKTCPYWHFAVTELQKGLPPLRDDTTMSFVELSRILVDYQKLSLTTVQGAYAWRIARCLWIYRCRVLFDDLRPHRQGFMKFVYEHLHNWGIEFDTIRRHLSRVREAFWVAAGVAATGVG